MNDYIVFDLEATCWERKSSVEEMEIIEIGAVRVDGDSYEVVDRFSEFVRPVYNPVLSEFCKELTTISQSDVDAAFDFPEILTRFISWIGDSKVTMCSWGDYDIRQITADCNKHQIPLPEVFYRHLNVKKEFARHMKIRPCGMKKALGMVCLSLDGTHHRGIDDAINIAKLFKYIILSNKYHSRME